MRFSTTLLVLSLSVGLIVGCGAEQEPEGADNQRSDALLVGGKADVPSWLRHIPTNWGCDQTLKGRFSGWDSAHLYSFPGKVGYEYTFSFAASYGWYRGAVVAVYDAETGKRVALARNRKDNEVSVVYTAERSVKYLVAVYSVWWWATGDYTLRADCRLVAQSCKVDADCAKGEFCKLQSCGFGGAGTCEARPSGCFTEIYAPVCGCDGRDYDTPCAAAQHGISVAHPGHCPQITVSPTQAAQGQSVKASVVNRSQFQSIFLDGCSPLSLQQKVAGAWTDRGPLKVCVWEGLAQELASLKSFDESVSPADVGTYRLVGAYSVDCTPGKPLSQAGCRLYRKMISPEFSIGAASCSGAWLDNKGNCRTPSDKVYPDSCCIDQLKQRCANINTKYIAAAVAAQSCSLQATAPQCQYMVASDLQCNICERAINVSPKQAGTEAITQEFNDLRCHRVPVMCPAYVCPPAQGTECAADGQGGGSCRVIR